MAEPVAIAEVHRLARNCPILRELGMHLTQVAPKILRLAECPGSKIARGCVCGFGLEAVLGLKSGSGAGFHVPSTSRSQWKGAPRQRTRGNDLTGNRARNIWWLPESSAYPFCGITDLTVAKKVPCINIPSVRFTL